MGAEMRGLSAGCDEVEGGQGRCGSRRGHVMGRCAFTSHRVAACTAFTAFPTAERERERPT